MRQPLSRFQTPKAADLHADTFPSACTLLGLCFHFHGPVVMQ